MGMMVTVGFSAAVKLNSGPTNPLAAPSGGTIPALTRKSNVAETLETFVKCSDAAQSERHIPSKAIRSQVAIAS